MATIASAHECLYQTKTVILSHVPPSDCILEAWLTAKQVDASREAKAVRRPSGRPQIRRLPLTTRWDGGELGGQQGFHSRRSNLQCCSYMQRFCSEKLLLIEQPKDRSCSVATAPVTPRNCGLPIIVIQMCWNIFVKSWWVATTLTEQGSAGLTPTSVENILDVNFIGE
jgi:hypothetical protein